MKLLQIDSSALGQGSASRQLTAAIVARFKRALPTADIVHHDLDTDPVPHLDSRTLVGTDTESVERGRRVLQDFLAADVIVIGAPMYNFGVPSALKAWIDRIAVAGTTFRYGPDGPEGLAGGKRVILAIAQGGVHPAGGPSDFQESYLRFVLGFLGITDIEVVRADGLAVGERREHAMAAALASLPDPERLAATA